MQGDLHLTLTPRTLDNAGPPARAVLEKALAQVGFVPNVYGNMVHAPNVLDLYLDGYASFRARSGFDSIEQEVVFLVLSRENASDYCVAAHGMLAATRSAVPAEVVAAIREDRPLADPRLAALARLTRAVVTKRGAVDDDDVRPFRAAGYREEQILQLILAAAVKTLSNYTNRLFRTPIDPMFADHA